MVDKLKIQKSDVLFLNMFDSKVLENLDTDTSCVLFPIVNYSGDVWFDKFRNVSVLVTSESVPDDTRYFRKKKMKIITKGKRTIKRFNCREVGKKGKPRRWMTRKSEILEC